MLANGLYPVQDKVLLVLTRVQTICKDYQQTTKVAAGKERVNKTEAINTEYPNERCKDNQKMAWNIWTTLT